jgi:UDP-glucose 4-epimerase
MATIAVTGAGGFIGAYLARELVARGHKVRCVDNYLRGRPERLEGLGPHAEPVTADVREKHSLLPAFEGCDAVFHLAAVNGTENFYNHPELVLDVGVRGMIAVAEACNELKTPGLVVASSAEVYQTPAVVPTNEDIELIIPNSLNPRYSYGASKLISELIAFNYCRNTLDKVQVFRPHNVYGPDMGWKHVIPQLIGKILAAEGGSRRTIEIQGDGSETRAFCYVTDIVDGIIRMWEKGETMNVYHIGSSEEVSIRDLVRQVGKALDIEVDVVAGPAMEGGTPRRCPDIGKMRALGYDPAVSLVEGVRRTAEWYRENSASAINALL